MNAENSHSTIENNLSQPTICDNSPLFSDGVGEAILRVHSTESFGSVDGPGIRFIIFLSGCAMRCRYCHNPDTWNMTGGTEMTVNELLDKAERYRDYWGDDGGITVSGGEALLQLDGLIALFTEAKRRGINTCLDTAGQPFTRQGLWFEKFEKLMSLTDTILLDLKHIDNEKHKWLTAHDNSRILDLAKYLSDTAKPVWIRHVLVPGITLNDDYLTRLRQFVDTLTNVERVEILPYHTLGIPKWQKLGIDYTLNDVPSPTREEVNHAREILGAR